MHQQMVILLFLSLLSFRGVTGSNELPADCACQTLILKVTFVSGTKFYFRRYMSINITISPKKKKKPTDNSLIYKIY